MSEETILYEAHPAMFKNHPIAFTILCLVPVVGWILLLFWDFSGFSLIVAIGAPLVGWIPLLIWYLESRATTLIVTNDQTTLRTGLLSKNTNDVFHENVRNIVVKQSFFQRLMGVGYIGISSAGHAGVEIEVNGLPDPDRVKDIIDDHRRD